MHQCVNVKIHYFAIFVPIFMKFSPNCRAKELGILFTILEVFAYFWIGKGPIFGPKIGLGKSLVSKENSKQQLNVATHLNLYCLLYPLYTNRFFLLV